VVVDAPGLVVGYEAGTTVSFFFDLGRRKLEAFEVANLVVGQDGPETVFGELQHFFSDEILVLNGGVVTAFGDGGIQLGEPVRVIKEHRDSVVVNTGEEVRGRMGDVTD
jgi:hypothetical protein